MLISDDGTINLTIGFSPCPNDTYIFDALVNGKLDTGPFRFNPMLLDVQELNRMAIIGELDITKISYRAYADCGQTYMICDSGSALGTGVGPLLVARQGFEEGSMKTVAIPGENTTANFLFRLYYPAVQNRVEMVFSEIEEAVLSGRVDAGVIIHENRFTYAEKGLVKISDLGAMWESDSNQPIPLGGIAVKRSLGVDTVKAVNSLIRKSLELANSYPSGTDAYVRLHAQSMDADVRNRHIALYVNDYSIDLGEHGRGAIRYMFSKAMERGVISAAFPFPMFVSELG